MSGKNDHDPSQLLTPEERGGSAVIADPSLPDTPIIYVSDEFERQTGYSREEVLGRNCRFLQGPETNAETVAILRSAIEAQQEITVDILNYRRDGSTFWNRLHIRPLKDQLGRTLYFAGVQKPIPAENPQPPRSGIHE